MKKIILMIFSFLSLNTTALALELKSKIAVDPTGEIEKFLEVSCSTKDNHFCQQLCQNPITCKVPEVLCEDCVTQKSQLIYTVFTDVNSIFKADILFIEPVQLMGFLKNSKFISIPNDLFINMFTPEKKEALKKEFEKLCYINVQSATLLATVNEQNQAEELVGVVCQDNLGSVVLPISLNPEFSNQQSDFWTKLNARIGYQTETLKLKMATELNLNTSTIIPNTDTSVSSVELAHRELSKSSICRIKNFTDGTSEALNKEYYDKCMTEKPRRK
jgi:hypothetical protein